jgi:glycosyltransferase involved in cell wall biosynthesis
MEISVVIPTFERDTYLRNALEGIVGQTLDKNTFEVLVIDNGNSSGTQRVVSSFKEQINHIHYLREKTPGLHAARHHGFRKACAEIIVFADDDIIPFPTWLEAIRESFKSVPEAVLVGGKSLPMYEINPPNWVDGLWEVNKWGKFNFWFSLIDAGENVKHIPANYVYGCNFAIKQKILKECGGFHPDAMPWDLRHLRGDGETYVSKWINDHRLITLYNPKASVYHFVSKERLTIEYLCKRAFLQAISDSYSFTRSNPRIFDRLLNIFLRIIVIIWREIIFKNNLEKRHWLHMIYGLIWHQTLVARDPHLLKWMTKDNYLP